MENIIQDFVKLLEQDKYISKKEYMHILKKHRDIADELDEQVEKHNKKFVTSKLSEYEEYFDKIFSKIDRNIKLDDEQKTAVLVDEDYCLVIAGAGSGKTTTLAAKVKYLVEKQQVKPEDILIISYTKKAVKELKDRINSDFKINSKVMTFHALGYEILRKNSTNIPSLAENTYKIFEDILINRIYKDENILKELIYFLACYLHLPTDALKFKNIDEFIKDRVVNDYITLKGNIEAYNANVAKQLKKYHKTIQGEILRSSEEVSIANFLYLNGIEYEYEKVFPYRINGSKKPYQPDFYIRQGELEAYIEHFGMYSRNKRNIYDEKILKIYEKSMNEKIKFHRELGTKLIDTYHDYSDGKDLIYHLKEKLINEGFVFIQRNPTDVYKELCESSKDKYIYSLIVFIIEFIEKFKQMGMKYEDFERLDSITENVRNKIFLNIAKYVYVEYTNELKSKNQIDFQDMINDAADVIEKMKQHNIKLSYKYIIVDEYQDIAKQRFNLTKKLSDVANSKVIAVGDDWQSIFAFAGSSSEYFIKFKELMGYAAELKITHTYRNSQELIDIAGGFVQKNSVQIQKRLLSEKHMEYPICIYGYNDITKVNINKNALLEKIIERIVKNFGDKTSILILYRYNFEKYLIYENENFEPSAKRDMLVYKKYPKLEITLLTAHKSKGLGYDNVILISAANQKLGFPSQIEDDPIMNLINEKQIEKIDYPEERRLFYVALTRTKNRIYIMAPIFKPSIFVQELIRDYNVYYDTNITTREYTLDNESCPICKFPLRYMRNKYIPRLNLWVCTNEPEVCDFMTNSKQKKADIHYCPKCNEGFMIVKKRKTGEGYILGCTNYKEDGTGCNHIEDLI